MNQTPTVARHQRPSLTARLAAVPDTRLPDPDPDDVDERPDRSRWWLVLLAFVALVAIVGVYFLASGGNTATEQRDTAIDQKLDLAGQVAAACASGQLAPTDRLCTKAAEAVAEPIPGRDGDPGRGITSTRIAAGRLLISYTDGTTEDVGPVAGANGSAGTNGTDGQPGRGIVSSTIEGGRLILSFSDGSRVDAGRVVGQDGADGRNGADGRGITSVAVTDGRLVVVFTDGTSQDLGPLPAGERGAQGVQGIGVSDVRAEQRDGRCVLVFTLTDPASSSTAEKVVAVPDGVCADSLLGP